MSDRAGPLLVCPPAGHLIQAGARAAGAGGAAPIIACDAGVRRGMGPRYTVLFTVQYAIATRERYDKPPNGGAPPVPLIFRACFRLLTSYTRKPRSLDSTDDARFFSETQFQ